jgi:hypothetical protein
MALSVIFRNDDDYQDLELMAHDLGPLDKPPFTCTLRVKGGPSKPFPIHPTPDGRGLVDWRVTSTDGSSLSNQSSSPVVVTTSDQIVPVSL